MIRVLLALCLTGCATTPIPPEILGAVNENTNCLAHAETAQERLGRGQIVVGVVPRKGFKTHAVLVVDGFVVDNGALAGPAWRVFRAEDLKRFMEFEQ